MPRDAVSLPAGRSLWHPSCSSATVSVLATGPSLFPLFLLPVLLGAVFFVEAGAAIASLCAGLVLASALAGDEATPGPAPRPSRRSSPALRSRWPASLSPVCSVVIALRHDELAATSLTDRLTGLYTYGTFVDYLRNEVRKAERYGGELCLIMVDLDHFKRFNDRYGHQVGNELLRRVGATLRGHVREADMAARYGGEEFALLIRGGEREGCELAERVRRAIEATGVSLGDGRVVFAAGQRRPGQLSGRLARRAGARRARRPGPLRIEAPRAQPRHGASETAAAQDRRTCGEAESVAHRLTPTRRPPGRARRHPAATVALQPEILESEPWAAACRDARRVAADELDADPTQGVELLARSPRWRPAERRGARRNAAAAGRVDERGVAGQAGDEQGSRLTKSGWARATSSSTVSPRPGRRSRAGNPSRAAGPECAASMRGWQSGRRPGSRKRRAVAPAPC